MPDGHIDISIELNGRQLDLRVPTAVTMRRLTDLIGEVLDEHGIAMPPRWRLEIKDKPIAIGDSDVLSEYPVGDGDVFEVVVLPGAAGARST